MYQEFAAVYDRFMDDFDYPAWADYYLEILKRQGYGGGEICEELVHRLRTMDEEK